MKTCSKCGQKKPKYWFNKNAASPDGLYSQCKICSRKISLRWYYEKGKPQSQTSAYKTKKAARHREYRQRLKTKNPYLRVAEGHRALARKIGMPFEELENWYNKQFMKQQAHCAICGKITEELCIDHNHTTNELRGLLCRNHNVGLSWFDDNPEFLRKAADYLAA